MPQPHAWTCDDDLRMQLNVNSSTIWQINTSDKIGSWISMGTSEWWKPEEGHWQHCTFPHRLQSLKRIPWSCTWICAHAAAPEVLISLLTSAFFAKQQSFGWFVKGHNFASHHSPGGIYVCKKKIFLIKIPSCGEACAKPVHHSPRPQKILGNKVL